MVALTEPEPGVGELALRVVICVTENFQVDGVGGFEWREAAFGGQGGESGEGGEGEGEFLFDFEEGHGWWDGGDGGLAGGEELCWSEALVM